ncbi:MAG TPA: diadenylate cyclase [Desulfatiglandales bacterium]|nr:diadenylate cyclase [Desulfatiglandales bacterium]
MRQNVILTHSGYTMYIVITDLEKKAKPAMFRISRPGLPFQKMERKLAGSMSSLLSGYYSKFYRRRDLERVIPALSHEFLQTAIAHQLKLANFSIEESLSIIKEFEKIVLWSYEGEPVATGLLLTRNFHDLKKNQAQLGIHITPVRKIKFGSRLLSLKRGVMIVDAQNNLFVIDRLKRILAIVSSTHDHASIDSCYVPEPKWVHELLKGRDWVIRTTQNREIEIICRGLMKLRYKKGLWSTVPLATFFETFKDRIGERLLATILPIIEEMSVRRLGALFVVIPSDDILDTFIDRKKDIVDVALRGKVNFFKSPTELLINLASVDGAVIVNHKGAILATGIHIKPSLKHPKPRVEGTRTAAAISASYSGYALKLSHDGDFEVYQRGKKVFQIA